MKSKSILLTLSVASAAIAQPTVDRTVLAADLLARADQLSSARAKAASKAFANTIAALDRLGVRADGTDAADQTLLAQWRAQSGDRSPPLRGRVLGPAFRRGWLDAGGALKLEQLFLAGQSASVAVAAAPGEGMRLAVSGPDAAGTCAGEGRSCRWTPIFTQRYTITIKNQGPSAARYYLVID